MGSLAEVYRTCGYQDPCARRHIDHVGLTEARTARNTSLSSVVSVPDNTRTTAPASLISITAGSDADLAGFTAGAASVTIGTNVRATSASPADGGCTAT